MKIQAFIIITVAILIFTLKHDSNEDASQKETLNDQLKSTELSTFDNPKPFVAAMSCPTDPYSIRKNIKKLKQKKNKFNRLFAGYYSTLSGKSEIEKETNIQLANIDLTIYRKEVSNWRKNEDYLLPLVGPETELSKSSFNKLTTNLFMRDYQAIMSMTEKKLISSSTAYRGYSILSYIIKNDRKVNISVIEMLINSGLRPSFPDLVNAIKVSVNQQILELLIAHTPETLNKIWYENFKYHSLATLAIQKNNFDAYLSVLNAGSPLTTVISDYTAIDFLNIPDTVVDVENAKRIFISLAKHNIMPYKLETIRQIEIWLPAEIQKDYSSYLNATKIHINEKIQNAIPLDGELYTNFKHHIDSINQEIKRLEDSLKNCQFETKNRSLNIKNKDSNEELLNKFDQVSNDIKLDVLTQNNLLNDKKWDEFLTRLYEFSNKNEIPEYKSFALVQLIQASAPLEIVEELLLDNEVIVLKEALSMAILKNDAEMLSLLVPYSLEIKAFSINDFFTNDILPTQIDDNILKILSEREAMAGAK